MTKNAKTFMEENDKSPVVEGWANSERGGTGGTYRLENDKIFKLSLKDCLALAHNYPKWKF